MKELSKILRVQNIPLSLVLVVGIVLANLIERVSGIVVIPSEDRATQVLTEVLLLCIVADLLRVFIRFVPIPGGEPAKRVLVTIVMLCSTALIVKADSITPFDFAAVPTSDMNIYVGETTSYTCENTDYFTIKQNSPEELQILKDGTVLRTVKRVIAGPVETYNDNHFSYTFTSGYEGQVEYTASVDNEPRSTICHETQVSVIGKVDPATHSRIMKIVHEADAEQNYQKETLSNDYFLSHGEPAYDGGQELTGYFKNGQLYKMSYSADLSYGALKYLFYYDGRALVYAYKEEDHFPPTADGTGLSHEKLDFAFGAGYFYDDNNLLRITSKGQATYAGELENMIGVAYGYEGLLEGLRSREEPATLYKNSDYGFSFTYPSSWTVKKTPSYPAKESFDVNNSGVFVVEFSDPVREKEKQIGDCVSNKEVGWRNASPTKEECAPLLATITPEEEATYNIMTPPRNIFVRVYKGSNLPLADWCLSR